MTLDLKSLEDSLKALDESLSAEQSIHAHASDALRATVRSGIIQNFQIAYEVSWKFMKRWIENQVSPTLVDGVPRRELFRIAAEHGLIDDTEQWFEYHKARNEMSHTYSVATAERIRTQVEPFRDHAALLLKNLQARND